MSNRGKMHSAMFRRFVLSPMLLDCVFIYRELLSHRPTYTLLSLALSLSFARALNFVSRIHAALDVENSILGISAPDLEVFFFVFRGCHVISLHTHSPNMNEKQLQSIASSEKCRSPSLFSF